MGVVVFWSVIRGMGVGASNLEVTPLFDFFFQFYKVFRKKNPKTPLNSLGA